MDYTWKELLTRLGLEARPQTGYVDMLAQDSIRANNGIPLDNWYRVNKYDTDFNRPIKNRPQMKVSIPNRELLISKDKFSEQPQFFKDYVLDRTNITRNLDIQNLQRYLDNKGISLRGSGWISDTNLPTEYYQVPRNNIYTNTNFRFPKTTLKMIGEKLMDVPGVKPSLNLMQRATIPTMIYQGLSQPTARDEDYFLEGGIKYYGD